LLQPSRLRSWRVASRPHIGGLHSEGERP
jgi:hypothetical protein